MGAQMDRSNLLQFFKTHARLLLDGDYVALAQSYGMPVSFHFVTGNILMETEDQLSQVMQRHRDGLKARQVTELLPWIGPVQELAPGRFMVSVTWVSQVDAAQPLRSDAIYFITRTKVGPKIEMVDFSVPAPARYEGLFFEAANATF